MIEAIQRAYYLQARNPSDTDTLIEIARDTGLDVDGFTRDFCSTRVKEELISQINDSRAMGVSSFPSLRLAVDGHIQAIDVDYRNHEPMLQQVLRFVER